MDTKWIDLSVRTFSPREFLCGLVGILCILASAAGKVHPVGALFGVVLFVFGFIPFGFLPPEKQISSFLIFHFKRDNSVKKSKKEESPQIGIGSVTSEEHSEDIDISSEKIDTAETVHIEDLDIPYTLTLKTSAKKQFVPVSVLFSDGASKEIPVANTVTGRKGKVFCTILLESYGQRRIRVTGDDGVIFYDKVVVFKRK